MGVVTYPAIARHCSFARHSSEGWNPALDLT
jgi:hypothetical protein